MFIWEFYLFNVKFCYLTHKVVVQLCWTVSEQTCQCKSPLIGGNRGIYCVY